jgi:hypothetical protein
MKRFLSVTLAVAVVALLAGAAFAQMGGGMRGAMGSGMGVGMMGGAMGPGMMGGGMGPGMMGGGPDGCPGMAGTGEGAAANITEDQALLAAQQYAAQYLQDFTVLQVAPFTGMHMTMFRAELSGPGGETRTLHINPWGGVMAHGPVTR